MSEGFDYYIDDNAIQVFNTRQLRVRDLAVFDERHIFSNVSDLVSRNTNTNANTNMSMRNQKYADHVTKTFTSLIMDVANPNNTNQSNNNKDDEFIQKYPLLIFPVVRIRKRLISMDDFKSKNVAQRFDPDIIVEDGPIRNKNPVTMGEFLQGRRQVVLTMKARAAEMRYNTNDAPINLNRPLEIYMTPFKPEFETEQHARNALTVSRDMEVIYKWQVQEDDPLTIERMRVLKDDDGIEHQGYMVLPRLPDMEDSPGSPGSQEPIVTRKSISSSAILKRPYIIDSLAQLPPAVDVIAELGLFDEPYAMYKRYPFLAKLHAPNINKLIKPTHRKKLSPRNNFKTLGVKKNRNNRKNAHNTDNIWKIVQEDVSQFKETMKKAVLAKLVAVTNEVKEVKPRKPTIPKNMPIFNSFEEAASAAKSYAPKTNAAIVLTERVVYIVRDNNKRNPAWNMIDVNEDNTFKTFKTFKRTVPAKALASDALVAQKTFENALDIIESLENAERDWKWQRKFQQKAIQPTGYRGPGGKRQQKGQVIGDFDLAETEAQRLRDEGFDRNFTSALQNEANSLNANANNTMLFEGVTLMKTDAMSTPLLSILSSIQDKLGVELTIAQQNYLLAHITIPQQSQDKEAAFQNKVAAMFIVCMLLVQTALPMIILKHRRAPKALDDDEQVIEFIVTIFQEFRRTELGDNMYRKWPKDLEALKQRFLGLWENITVQHVNLSTNAAMGCGRIFELREKAKNVELISSRYPVWTTFLPFAGSAVIKTSKKTGKASKTSKHSKHSIGCSVALQKLRRRGLPPQWGFQNHTINQSNQQLTTIIDTTRDNTNSDDSSRPHVRHHITEFVKSNPIFTNDEHLKDLIKNCESRKSWNAFSSALNDATSTATMRQRLIADTSPDNVAFYMNFIKSDVCQFLSRVANKFQVNDGLPDDSPEKIIATFANNLHDTSIRRKMLKLSMAAQHGLEHVIFGVNAAPHPEQAMYFSHYVFATIYQKAMDLMTPDMQTFIDDLLVSKFDKAFKTRDEVRANFEKDREKKKQDKILTMRALDNETRLYIKQLQSKNILNADDVLKMDLDDIMKMHADANATRNTKKNKSNDDDGWSDGGSDGNNDD